MSHIVRKKIKNDFKIPPAILIFKVNAAAKVEVRYLNSIFIIGTRAKKSFKIFQK